MNRFALACVFAGLLRTAPAAAEPMPFKLDPRARLALEQLRAGVPVATLRARRAAVSASGALDVIVTGDVSRAAIEATGARVRTLLHGACTVDLPPESVDALSALPGVRTIEGAVPLERQLDVSVPATNVTAQRGPPPAFAGPSGRGVLVGDVDTGVDYDHPDFRDSTGATRFLAIWDQNYYFAPPPPGYAYGEAWSRSQIDSGLAITPDSDGHGTEVMGILAGDGSGTGGGVPPYTYVGMAPNADLIAVSSDFLTTRVIDGVRWIFDQATAAGKNAVVNLSIGTQYGPHDGSSGFESALTALTGPGRIITVAAGNYRDRPVHAEALFNGEDSLVTFFVDTPSLGSYFDIAGYYDGPDSVTVTLRSPGGRRYGPVPFGRMNRTYPGQSTPSGTVYIENGLSLTASGARYLYLEIQQFDGQYIGGPWRLSFTPASAGAESAGVDLWRYFGAGPVQVEFGLGSRPDRKLVSEPGNAVDLLTVAAYTTKEAWTDCQGLGAAFIDGVSAGSLCPFSSPGPSRDGREKPDLAAPGSAIASTTSFDVLPGCTAVPSVFLADSLHHRVDEGTSLAAPHVAGAVALLLEKYGAVGPAFVRDYLVTHARHDVQTGPGWNADWGRGKLWMGDLVDPVARLEAPAGGESFLLGDTAAVRWDARDDFGGVTAVDLGLSRTGAAGPFEPIASGLPAHGVFTWKVNGPPTADALVRVVARDAEGNVGADTSAAVFRIDSTTATVLERFEAVTLPGRIALRWTLGDPDAFAALRLERAERAEGPWALVASLAPRVSEADDEVLAPGGSRVYRLVGIDAGGAQSVLGMVEATPLGLPRVFALAPPAPDPASGPVRISFALPRRAAIRLDVLDVQGRAVAALARGTWSAGEHVLAWNGGGARAGLYFVRFRTPDGDRVRRLIRTP